ncbi:MAG: 4Fe-4S dicluster domain-containing protein [Planctomycetota bacterium]|nr:4Fe-4S dicluster domain-containing protein [Planctomycetota bacterium]
MSKHASPTLPAPVLWTRGDMDRFFETLRKEGYQPVGPTLRDGAIVYDTLSSTRDLPVGWGDEQEPGAYRLRKRGDEALFGYVVGPQSWKQYLFPPRRKLWSADRAAGGLEFKPSAEAPPKYAFIGVRGCELHALQVQDKAFLEGPYADPYYRAVREGSLVVAVNCGTSAATCFCASMGTGPKVERGFDLALTELLDGGQRFVVEAGSARGAKFVDELSPQAAAPEDLAEAARVVERTAATLRRKVEPGGLRELLARNLEHPRWDEVASRCQTCANCTLVCPTCFCSTVEDVSDLTGEHAERWRRWDSCFTFDHSYLHGGAVRASAMSRYRQWLTHKFGTWHDQFGVSGCVGCGRCISWCPVGIDVTEELAAIRANDLGKDGEHAHP